MQSGVSLESVSNATGMSYVVIILGVVLAVGLIGGLIALIVGLANKNKPKAPAPVGDGSYFDGGTLGLIGWRVLAGFLVTITLGIAFPWAMCMLERWKAKHTVINGRRLKFTGSGLGLLGKYLLGMFLTFITFGIYGIWFGLSLEKWRVKHLVYEDDDGTYESKFTAGVGGWFVNCLLKGLITAVTLGIGYAWAEKRFIQWKLEHTQIGGSTFVFNGTGSQLFVKYLLLGLLTPLTLGIYAIFFPVILMKWETSNTEALYRTAKIRALATAHQEDANKDFAKFRLTANDMELSLVKQGINGNETDEQLRELADGGSAYAQYQMALKLKSENEAFEGEAFEYLQKSAEGKYHPALYAFALAQPDGNYAVLLEESAKQGNTEAPFLLKNHYENLAYTLRNSKTAGSLDALKRSAYWFKIAIEQENPQALDIAYAYDKMVETIAIWQSQEMAPEKKSSPIIVVVLILALLLLVGVIGGAVFAIFRVNVDISKPTHTDSMRYECLSESMEPALELGETYYFSPIYDAYTLEVGDIVLVDSEYGRVAHRIHEIKNEDGIRLFILKGDNNAEVDDRVYYGGDLLGVLENELSEVPSLSIDEGSNEGSKKDEPVQEEQGRLVIVDRVDGFDEAMAVERFENQGFKVKVKYKETNDYTNGTVISQSVDYGTELEKGSTITIVVAKEKPTEDNSKAQKLWGMWQAPWREGNIIYVNNYDFKPDGTFSVSTIEYENAQLTGFQGESGWYVVPKGAPQYSGTYTVEGSTVKFHYTRVIGEGGDESVDSTEQWTLVGTSSFEIMAYNDTQNMKYMHLVQYGQDFEKLCLYANVDTSV